MSIGFPKGAVDAGGSAGAETRVVAGRRRAGHRAPALERSAAVVRAVVAALTVAALVVGGLVLGSLLAAPDSTEVVVQSGDTIWSIASRLEGGPDTAAVVSDIVALNGLGSQDLDVGQTLLVPSY
ncbi:MAG: LysM peptidoglycan-binding domain-containing protein [Actinomycetaceae bacterium]|nr:LysM peptidoglycan-binding domain-containing protein [Actinomycetaceae bacterium]